jgi:phage tail protein X
MAQVIPGSKYTVQEGDTLSSIAEKAYGDSNQWHEIYIANTQGIGNNPSMLVPGTALYIPQIQQSPRNLQALAVHTCKVTAPDGVNVRTRPSTQSYVVETDPCDSVLYYLYCLYGEAIDGNPNWAFSIYGHYFWLGATDHPDC